MTRLHNKTLLNLILIAVFAPVIAMNAETVEYDGLIEPYAVVDIGSPAEGIVDRVTVDRSNSVKKGQTLVVMESSVERAVLAKAKAMATFDSEIGLQNTQLTFAIRTHDRFKSLKGIANYDKDQAATEILRVKHRLEQAREKITLAKLELRKAQAVVNRVTASSAAANSARNSACAILKPCTVR